MFCVLGVISACHSDGTYDIQYDDGDAEYHIKPMFIRFKPSNRNSMELTMNSYKPAVAPEVIGKCKHFS